MSLSKAGRFDEHGLVFAFCRGIVIALLCPLCGRKVILNSVTRGTARGSGLSRCLAPMAGQQHKNAEQGSTHEATDPSTR